MTDLPIGAIRVDTSVQLHKRGIDQGTVNDYILALSGGAQFPPVVVFDDGADLWLADGFHRISAYRFLGHAEVLAEVRQGSRDDARVYAATANTTNGKPMSQAEKREAGERLLKLTDWSQHRIAQELAVSQPAVHKWAESLSNNKLSDRQPTDTRNGTTYTMDTANIGKRAEPEPDADPLLLINPEPETRTAAPTAMPSRDYEPAPIVAQLPEQVRLICGDFAAVDLPQGGFDFIITDPPYPQEYLDLYDLLAKRAADVLKPGGSLLAMCGQSYLPQIYAALIKYLTYHWTISYLTPGGQSVQVWPRKINTFWKPVLWFTKGEYRGKWVGDVTRSDVNDNDKRFHKWGQSESGMSDLVERLTLPGDHILDPFCGAGTTGVVAAVLRRRFTGIDIDQNHIESAKRRIANAASERGANWLAGPDTEPAPQEMGMGLPGGRS